METRDALSDGELATKCLQLAERFHRLAAVAFDSTSSAGFKRWGDELTAQADALEHKASRIKGKCATRHRASVTTSLGVPLTGRGVGLSRNVFNRSVWRASVIQVSAISGKSVFSSASTAD